MDHEALLSYATNPAVLKAAVDAVPRGEKNYTAEIRDALLQKKNLIVDAPTADAVVSLLSAFSVVDSKRDLLRIAEVRDLIIDVLAPKISAGDPVENLGRMIYNIVVSKFTAELYSNRKSFSAILDCFHHATTAGSAEWFARCTNNICNMNPGANKIFNDLPVVRAYSAIIPYANDDAAAQWICNSLDQILKDNEPAEKMFGTRSFRAVAQTMEMHVTPDGAKSSIDNLLLVLQCIIAYPTQLQALWDASTSVELKAAVDAIPREDKLYAEIRVGILRKRHLIVDAPTADAVVSFLSAFSVVDSKRDLLRIAEVRDLIIDVLAPKISDGDPVENLGKTISTTTLINTPGSALFCNQKTFSAILGCFHHATTAGSAEWIVYSISYICKKNPGANKILNNLPVVESYSAAIPYATDDQSVRWISLSIEEIMENNEPAQKLFGTLAFFEKFRSMERYPGSARAKSSFNSTMNFLLRLINVARHLQSLRDASTTVELTDAVDAIPRELECYTNEIRDVLLQKQHLIVDAPSADSVVALLNVFRIESLRTTEIRDLIIDVLAPKVSARLQNAPIIARFATSHQAATDRRR